MKRWITTSVLVIALALVSVTVFSKPSSTYQSSPQNVAESLEQPTPFTPECNDLLKYKPRSKEDLIIMCKGNEVKSFVIGYSKDLKISKWTIERIKPPFQSGNRTNDFHEDQYLSKQYRSTLKEYKAGSDKFDRGHLVPAGDQPKGSGLKYKDAMSSTFVLSNTVPQFKEFNRGAWNSSVEGAVRNYSERNPQNSVVVLTGTNGEIEKMGSVSVPKYMWKLVYDETAQKSWAYNLENTPKTKVSRDNLLNVNQLEHELGLKFRNIK
jgi:endonuclease G